MTRQIPGASIGNNFSEAENVPIGKDVGVISDIRILRDGMRMPMKCNYDGDTAGPAKILKNLHRFLMACTSKTGRSKLSSVRPIPGAGPVRSVRNDVPSGELDIDMSTNRWVWSEPLGPLECQA